MKYFINMYNNLKIQHFGLTTNDKEKVEIAHTAHC